MLRPAIDRVLHDKDGWRLDRLVTGFGVLLVVLVIVALPFPLDAALLAAPLVAVVLLVHPVLMPLGILASVPVQDLAPVPEGVPLTATRAAVAGSLAIAPILIFGRIVAFRFSRFILIGVLYVATLAVSLWSVDTPATGYPEIYRWIIALLAFWLVLQFIRTRRQVIATLLLMAGIAIVQGVLGALQALLGIGPESFEIGPGFSRAYGTFGMPNSYAAYIEIVALPLIPVTVWALIETWRRFGAFRRARVAGFLASTQERRGLVLIVVATLVLGAGAAAGMAGMAMSFSRGGWLGTAAALFVMVILLGRRTVVASTITAFAIGIVLFAGASGTVLTVLEDRFSQLVEQAQIGDIRGVPVTDENFAAVERMAHWQTAIAMWDSSPWTGIGVGEFDNRFKEFAVHPDFIDSQGHAHNYYLHVLAETGVLGLLAYLALIGAGFWVGWRAYRSPDGLASAIGIGAIGVTTALTVHNMFENLHVLNISIQLMAVWALAVIVTLRDFTVSRYREASNRETHMLYDFSR